MEESKMTQAYRHKFGYFPFGGTTGMTASITVPYLAKNCRNSSLRTSSGKRSTYTCRAGEYELRGKLSTGKASPTDSLPWLKQLIQLFRLSDTKLETAGETGDVLTYIIDDFARLDFPVQICPLDFVQSVIVLPTIPPYPVGNLQRGSYCPKEPLQVQQTQRHCFASLLLQLPSVLKYKFIIIIQSFRFPFNQNMSTFVPSEE